MRATVRAAILRLAVPFMIAAVGMARPSAAQEQAPPRFSISVGGGPLIGGPAASTAHALRDLGFDETDPGGCLFGLCWGPTEYPTHERGQRVSLALRYEISPPWALSFGRATESGGRVAGRRADGLYVLSEWQGTTHWGVAHYGFSSGASIGGGVSLHRFARPKDPFDPHSVTRVGLTVESNIRRPRGRRFFIDVSLRGHWVPNGEDVVYQLGAPPSTPASVSLPTGWSHLSFEVGAGLRL